MPPSSRLEAQRPSARQTLQLAASLLLAVTPASANGTFDLSACPDADIRELHIDRTIDLVSVTRNGQTIDTADAPALTMDGERTNGLHYRVIALVTVLEPTLGLVTENGSLGHFTMMSNSSAPTP